MGGRSALRKKDVRVFANHSRAQQGMSTRFAMDDVWRPMPVTNGHVLDDA